MIAPRSDDGNREEDDRDDDDDDEARHGPVRDVRREEHVDEQERHGDEIEHAVGENGAEETRPRSLLRHAPVEHRDPGQLADSTGKDRVREQADGERREDEQKARIRLFECLDDHRAPRKGAHENREQIEADGDGRSSDLTRRTFPAITF